ncbi:cytosine permease [Peptoniphilus porci]|uniref:Thiamine permease n=1 Tax=Peptoniphilus porci TaxID=2652280 RepID=A0A1U7M185_9FIRM|nr:cytosine permease [Peptoniphilus porci]OLR65414.1 thiamine permease [Peptoniphilus porci]
MKDNNSLKNKELMPTQDSERTMSLADYIILWSGMTINIVAFSLGAQYFDNGKGLSPLMISLVMIIGYGIVTLLTAMVGDIGTKYGIPFAAYIRAPFGYKGSYIASIIRAIPGLYWFGFLTWVGANSLNTMFGILAPGFDNLTIIIIIFAAVQIMNTMYGVEAMAKFGWIAIPCLAIMFTAITIKIMDVYSITIPDVMATTAEGGYSIPFAISGIAGGWITMALNGGDLTRQIKRYPDYYKMNFWQRNKRAIIGQVIGLMLVGVLTMLVGVMAGITTGFWDLNDVVPHLFTNKFTVSLCLIVIMFAQWSTNTAANLLPPSLALLNIFPKLKYSYSTIICGCISILMMPWKLQSQGGFLVTIQSWISLMLGPIIGIILTDYFLIRKTQVNIKDLYDSQGQYYYKNGYNFAAVLATFLSFVLALFTGDYAFYTGLTISVVIYYVLMKFVVLNKYEQNIGKSVLLEED